jgi:hypothetical protein
MSDFRYNKNLALMAVLEATYGVENTTFGAGDAVLLTEEPEYKFEWFNVDRDLQLPFYGVSEQLPATGLVKSKFKTEIVASGTAGTPPPIGKLLIACGFTETIFAANRVEYTLRSQDIAGLTQRFLNDGVRYISKGGRGRVKLDLSAYKAPKAEFEFWSLARVESIQAMPSVDYTAFKLPEVVTDANSGDIKFGATLAAGVLTGGTAYKSKGIMIDVATKLNHYKNLGGEDIGISDRKITGNITVALSEAQELQWYTDIKAVTKSTVSFSHGTAAGKRIIVHGRAVQRYNMDRVNDEGRLMFKSDLGYIPEGADNELVLIFK